MNQPEQISAADLLRLAPSPSVRKFGGDLVIAAGEYPILDVACGGGRNSAWIAYLGGRVAGLDIDLSRIKADRDNFRDTALSRAFKRVELLEIDLSQELWPYPPSSIGGIVNIHFLQHSLLLPFCDSLVPGGLLILETVEARGNNYLHLPKVGFLRKTLEKSLSFLVYKERRVGPNGLDAATVQIVGRKR